MCANKDGYSNPDSCCTSHGVCQACERTFDTLIQWRGGAVQTPYTSSNLHLVTLFAVRYLIYRITCTGRIIFCVPNSSKYVTDVRHLLRWIYKHICECKSARVSPRSAIELKMFLVMTLTEFAGCYGKSCVVPAVPAALGRTPASV